MILKLFSKDLWPQLPWMANYVSCAGHDFPPAEWTLSPIRQLLVTSNTWEPLLYLYTYFACWYWKLSQLPRATEVMDCRIKSTTLLDSVIAHYILNLILTCTAKCSCIPHQSSFSSQQLETSTENHNWTQCRGQHAHRAPSSNRHSHIIAPEFIAQGTLWKKDFKSRHNQEVCCENLSSTLPDKEDQNNGNINRQVTVKEGKFSALQD